MEKRGNGEPRHISVFINKVLEDLVIRRKYGDKGRGITREEHNIMYRNSTRVNYRPKGYQGRRSDYDNLRQLELF